MLGLRLGDDEGDVEGDVDGLVLGEIDGVADGLVLGDDEGDVDGETLGNCVTSVTLNVIVKDVPSAVRVSGPWLILMGKLIVAI